MSTVRTLITDALQDLGAIGVNEIPSDAEMSDAFRALNKMLSSWQTEKLIVYAENQEVFTYPLTGQKTYTIGPTGDFVTTRPVTIDFANNRDSNDNDYPFYIAKDFIDYAQIVSKGVTAQIQTVLYYDPTQTNGTIYLWPTPSDSSYRLVLWTRRTVTEFSTIDDVIALPPGYEEAIQLNLSIRLAPRYGRVVTPEFMKMAIDAKAQIKRTNTTVATLKFNFGNRRGNHFNYYTGQVQ